MWSTRKAIQLNNLVAPVRLPARDWLSKDLIEALPAAVYVCDIAGVVVAFNRRAAEIWGRAPALGETDEKFCGAHRLYHADGNYMPHAETPMAAVLRAGAAVSDVEAIIEQPDGTRISVLINIAPLFDDAGTQVGAVNCFQNLNAQKLTEKERDDLEQNLRQSQKMEAVGQLTGGLAHDFNNLLASIQGNLEMLRKRIGQGDTTGWERYVDAAHRSAERAALLTHRLLAFSRMQTLDPKATDVEVLVHGMHGLIRGSLGPEIEIEFVATAGLWSGWVDAGQLENALLNLCLNARDAMPAGGKLMVEASNMTFDDRSAREQDLTPGDYISLSVSDTGVGMSADVAARAFEPFYTTKPLGSGTGLGLSMVYGFARQSGGHARIYSEENKGTRVALYLPRHIAIGELAKAVADLAPITRAGKGAVVLVVDDEAALCDLVSEVVEDMGYMSLKAISSGAALRILMSDVRIDLLITDVGLPGGMNGRQLAEAARTRRAGLKVLFVTGYAENAVLSHGHLEPGMHVATKPFALDGLATKISSLMLEAA